MFINKKRLGAIAAFLSVSSFAQAADFYAGANLARMTDKGDLAPAIHPTAIAITGGVQLNKYFALEARASTGIKKDQGTVNGITYDLKFDRLYGAFVKGRLPLWKVSPYLLAGYSYVRETAHIKAMNLSMSASEHSFSYGFGVDVPITQTISAHLEWARFMRGIDDAGVGATIRGTSVGVSMKF